MKKLAIHITSGDVWGGSVSQVSQLAQPELFSDIQSSDLDRDNSKPQPSWTIKCILFNEGSASERLLEMGINPIICHEKSGILSLIKSVSRTIAHEKPDIIIAHGYKEAVITSLISLKHGIPWVLQVHGSTENYMGFKRIRARLYSSLQFFLAKILATKIIFVSKQLKYFFGFEKSPKAVVILNASDIPPLTKEIESPSSEIDQSEIKLLWLGRMAPVKRPDIVIDAYNAFLNNYLGERKVHLYIAGDGPLLELTKKRASNIPSDKISFLNYISDLETFFSAQGIVLLTSDSEGIPTALLEAMHQRCPIITRDVGGISEIYEKISNYPMALVKSDSPDEFAEAIRFGIAHIDKLRLEARSCDTSYFSSKRMIMDHFDLYFSILRDT